MKIAEAKELYQSTLREYRDYQNNLIKQKKELEQKQKYDPEGKEIYEKESVILELTIRAVEEKREEYQKYISDLNQQWTATANAITAKQQGDAAAEYVEDMGKIMEVARRLMKGAIVPPQDEKKLMEYSMEMYQMAKNMGALARQKEKEEYDSLWEDEEKKTYEDPMEVADNTTAFAEGPDIVSASDIADSIAGGERIEG